MNPGHELVSTAAADAPAARPGVSPAPTPSLADPVAPGLVLEWIAASSPEPWFPSVYARGHGLNRDCLDEPLNTLRNVDLVRIATWVRGDGQGYVLTPAGEAAAKDPAALERTLRSGLTPLPSAAPIAEPDTAPTAPAPSAEGPIEFRLSIVTPALIGINLLWFFIGLLIAAQSGISTTDYLVGRNTDILHRMGAISGPDLLSGQWWRLLTSCFVHIGGLHLLVNLVALGMMGPLAELLWGRGRLLLIYAIAGLAGSCLAMALEPIKPDSGAVTLLAGASGAIWGVLGSLFGWMLLYRHTLPDDVAAELFRRLTVVVLLNIGFSLLPTVSWQAHLGGGLAGFLAVGALNALRFGDRPRKLWGAVALVALPLLSIGGLVATMQSGDAWAALRTPPTKRPGSQAAIDAYNQTVVPLLMLLAPEPVDKVEREAKLQLVRAVWKKPPVLPQIVSRVQQLRTIAADAVAKLSEPQTGVGVVDEKRVKARAFAEARLKSFDLLLALLANPGDPAAFDAWLAAAADANRLWSELGQK